MLRTSVAFSLFYYFRDISIKNKYAFVDFEDYRDADDAVYDLHKKEFMGEVVRALFYYLNLNLMLIFFLINL